MNTKALRPLLSLGLAAALLVPAQQPAPPPRHAPLPPGPFIPPATTIPRSNGISVGRPKIFDNRSLTLMLENLSETLRGMHTQFLAPADVTKALGNLQAFRSTETVSNLSVSTLPIPGVKQELISTTGNVTTDGKTTLPDTTKSTANASRDAIVPAAPQLDTIPDFKGFTPSFGPNAADLLSDQVNLTYQILNLRMILERSLSDRLLNGGGTRLQAVVGFNVTIDPPRTANDAVAVVEVTIESETTPGVGDGMSMVALMPQEKTYNASTLSSKSHQFGGSAVVKLVQVGYSQRRRGQTFFLYRDTDTLSYERMIDGDDKLQFGWMFRPVLGRRSVSPGLRQMFAVIALPAVDGGISSHRLKATVRTYWKKYDANTMTSYMPADANRARRAGFVGTFGLNYPQVFTGAWNNTALYTGIEVKPTGEYQRELRPRVETAFWRPAGPKSAYITVQGKNFFTGTQVLMGDKTFTGQGDGLTLKSNETLEIATSTEALATGPGVVSGRYGGSIPVLIPDPPGVAQTGVEIHEIKLGPSIGGSRRLQVFLKARGADGPLKVNQLPMDTIVESQASRLARFKCADPGGSQAKNELCDPGRQKMLTEGLQVASDPILTVNSRLVEMPYSIREEGEKDKTMVVLEASVKDSILDNGTGVVKVSWPFLAPARWTSAKAVFDSILAFEVIRLGPKSVYIRKHDSLAFTEDPNRPDLKPTKPKDFCWQVASGTEVQKLQSATCDVPKPTTDAPKPAGDAVKPQVAPSNPPIEPSTHALSVSMKEDIPDKIILIAPNTASYILDVPKNKKTEDPGPTTINQNDSLWIEIAVKGSTDKATVEANGATLQFRDKAGAQKAASAAGGEESKTIEAHITRDLTAKPGLIEVTVTDKGGKKIGSAKLSIACLHCDSGERK